MVVRAARRGPSGAAGQGWNKAGAWKSWEAGQQVVDPPFWTGPVLTTVAALAVGVLAPDALPVPASVLLLLAVALTATLGGWRSGALTAGIAAVFLGWMVSHGATARSRHVPYLWLGALSFPAALAVGSLLHRQSRPAFLDRTNKAGGDDGFAGSPRAEDERFRQLVMQVEGVAIFMLDASGHNRTWNEGARAAGGGYGEREWVGGHAPSCSPPKTGPAASPPASSARRRSTGRRRMTAGSCERTDLGSTRPA